LFVNFDHSLIFFDICLILKALWSDRNTIGTFIDPRISLIENLLQPKLQDDDCAQVFKLELDQTTMDILASCIPLTFDQNVEAIYSTNEFTTLCLKRHINSWITNSWRNSKGQTPENTRLFQYIFNQYPDFFFDGKNCKVFRSELNFKKHAGSFAAYNIAWDNHYFTDKNSVFYTKIAANQLSKLDPNFPRKFYRVDQLGNYLNDKKFQLTESTIDACLRNYIELGLSDEEDMIDAYTNTLF